MKPDPAMIAVMSYSRDARKVYVSFTAAIVLPACISFCAGLYVGLLSGTLAWMFGLNQPLRIGLVCSSIAGLVAWLLSLKWWRDMVTGVEAALMSLANPNVAIDPVRVVVPREHGRVLGIEKLPVTRAQLIEVAKVITAGGTLSVRNLSRIFISAAEAQSFMTELVAYGYAEWRNSAAPTQGMKVTEKGMALFRQTLKIEDDAPLSPSTHGLLPVTRGYYHEHTRAQESEDDYDE